MAALQETYLLDTNILSDMMRNPEGLASQRFIEALQNKPNARLWFQTDDLEQATFL